MPRVAAPVPAPSASNVVPVMRRCLTVTGNAAYGATRRQATRRGSKRRHERSVSNAGEPRRRHRYGHLKSCGLALTPTTRGAIMLGLAAGDNEGRRLHHCGRRPTFNQTIFLPYAGFAARRKSVDLPNSCLLRILITNLLMRGKPFSGRCTSCRSGCRRRRGGRR